MKHGLAILPYLGLLHWSLAAQPTEPIDYAIQVTAAVRSTPPEIALSWPKGRFDTGYTISRKSLEETEWSLLANLPDGSTNFVDHQVAAGAAYEYQLTKTTTRGFTGYGYIYAGIEASLIDERGKVVLLADSRVSESLQLELERLIADWVGDGWIPVRHDIPPDMPVQQVRELIRTEYRAAPERVRAVFLFGHIPVPYSGNILPDGHLNHQGAWPADAYYGDMDGVWTDETVNSTNAEKTVNWNVPGDGKFDQDRPPGGIRLEVGRVDFQAMTSFANKAEPRSETDLLREYLDRNHRFRHGMIPVQRQALLADFFPDKGDDPVGANAWRHFSAFFSPENITVAEWEEYFPLAEAESYLWSFGAGGGSSYTVISGIGTSDDFALRTPQVIFTMFLGSFFGDWNNESNLLRAALGSGNILAVAYSGFPHWLLHPMALGETIGFSARLTQNNAPGGAYPPYNQGAGEVHIALLGDPTLRMHPVEPPSGLQISLDTNGVALEWAPSGDDSLVGYHVYRRKIPAGPFTRLTDSNPVSAPAFLDKPGSGTNIYMVRAIKLETTPSGTYFNPSQGLFGTIHVTDTPWTPSTGEPGDPEPPGEQPPPVLSISPGQTEAGFTIRVEAPGSRTVALDFSVDLLDWIPLSTNTITSGIYELREEPSSRIRRRFYRARVVP